MYYIIANNASLRNGCIVISLITISTLILYKITKELDINNDMLFSEIMLHI